MTKDLTTLSAGELSVGYRSKDFKVVEVTEALLSRIEKENPKLNAFLEVYDDVLEQAARADKQLQEEGERAHSLCGIPIGVKDNILIKGRTVSSASKMLEHYTATYDATVIQKLKNAGVIFVGRTNMDEFAMGSSTEHSAFGPTRNPHDLERVPGGTSGGSAAAVAARLVPVALGSETCGSVRQPASLCGVIGLKPTYGAVSRFGLMAMGSSLDQIAPVSRTVHDMEVFFETIRGNDPHDATTLPDGRDKTIKHKRIGVPRAFVDGAQEAVRDAFERNLDQLASAGYDIVDIELPNAPYALAAYYIVMPAEVSTNLARYDGVRYGLHESGENLLDDYKRSREAGFGTEVKRRIILGTYVLSAGYYDAYYGKATALRQILARELDDVFEKVSFIATPAAPNPAFKIGEKTDPVSMYLQDIFHAPANLTGVPSLAVPGEPVEVDGKPLPVGIQFMSPKYTEKALFSVARDFLNET